MQRTISLLFSCTFAVACPDETPRPNGESDASAHDAVVHADAASADAEARDADPADAITFPDADERDADAPDAVEPDADAPDADAPDAGGPIDGGFDCAGLGTACSAKMACPAPLVCNDLHGICLPDRTIDCGGFVMAMCPAMYPACLFFDSSDYGPCFTIQERACICATPEGQATFPDC